MSGKAGSAYSLREGSLLPQLGFGSDCDFASLVQSNRFVFRVYTPKQDEDSADGPFVAPRFNKKHNRSPCDLPVLSASDLVPAAPALKDLATYKDASAHFNWTSRKQSPFISTSFCFAWAIWEALRRYRECVKHDVHIAIVDALTLKDRCLTDLELLKRASPDERHADHWRWCRFARESQSVLVYGCIPESSVLASVPLTAIVPHLPSYFLQFPEQFSVRSVKEPGLLDVVVWPKPRDGKPNYRQFCTTLSEKFLGLPTGVRLYDSTIGSVRLALALLQSWFDGAVAGDDTRIAVAVKKVSELAWNISCWVDEQRVTLNLDLEDTIEGIVRRVAEEVRARRKVELEDKLQIGRLQWAIDELSKVVGDYEEQIASHVCEDSFGPPLTPIPEVDDDDDACSVPESPTGTAVHSLPPSPPMSPNKFVRRHKLSISSDDETVVSRSASPFKPGKSSHTPLRLIFPPSPSLDAQKELHEGPPSPAPSEESFETPADTGMSLMASAMPRPSTSKESPPLSPVSFFRILLPEFSEPSSPDATTNESSASSEAESSDEKSPSDATKTLPVPPSSESPAGRLPPSSSATSPTITLRSLKRSDSLCSVRDYYCKHCREQIGPFGYAITGNIGCVVTGFLVGAFIALCVVNSQKRTLLVAT